ncbi:helix-turn-helix domain-containing protein [Thermodesulfobacterium hydrogeniphilum]|uniref:helix-turn-helix domain-containing protein n=1 Tax=Thermodesulfobacterium hydrogeniphilum TaxID=161156 RepID=UPI00056DFACA|nr:helix-turn-helix domain-containing protein [Thermodesulfobacterium hydrogeniphilum]
MKLKISQAIQRLPFPLNPETLRRAIKAGELKAQKFGKLWLVEEKDLENWISQRFNQGFEKNS